MIEHILKLTLLYIKQKKKRKESQIEIRNKLND